MIVLDTNVVSELMRPRPDAHVVTWVDSVANPFIAAITVQELYFGIEVLGPSRRADELLRRLDLILDRVLVGRVLPLTAGSARIAAALIAHRRRSGTPVSTADAQIAGIVLERGGTLATRNTRDFAGMRLDLVNPWEPVDPG